MAPISLAKVGNDKCWQRHGDQWKASWHNSLNEVSACSPIQTSHVSVNVPNKILTWVHEGTRVRMLTHFGCSERVVVVEVAGVGGRVEECPSLGERAGEMSVVDVMEYTKPFQATDNM